MFMICINLAAVDKGTQTTLLPLNQFIGFAAKGINAFNTYNANGPIIIDQMKIDYDWDLLFHKISSALVNNITDIIVLEKDKKRVLFRIDKNDTKQVTRVTLLVPNHHVEQNPDSNPGSQNYCGSITSFNFKENKYEMRTARGDEFPMVLVKRSELFHYAALTLIMGYWFKQHNKTRGGSDVGLEVSPTSIGELKQCFEKGKQISGDLLVLGQVYRGFLDRNFNV
jgi:hypothetical protein